MRTQIVRTMNLGDAGRFSCTWTNSTSLLEGLISTYSRPSPPPPRTRAAASQAGGAPPPLMMLPRMGVRKDGGLFYRLFNPVDKKFSVVTKHFNLPHSAQTMTSSKGWVTSFNPRDGALYVWDPLSDSDVHKDVHKLPSAGTLPSVVDIRFVRRNGSYTATIRDFAVVHSCRSVAKPTNRWMATINGSFSKAPDDDNHCIAFGYYGLHPALHYSEIGGSAWKALDAPLGRYAQVLASSKMDKLFFALNVPGEIEAWDLRDLSNIKRTLVTEGHRFFFRDDCPIKTDSNGRTYSKKEFDYLVELSGDLLLVTRYISCYIDDDRFNGIPYYRTNGFVVRKLNFGLRTWESVNCLSRYAIFLGASGESFSLRACDHSGLEENAIYFAPADQFSEYGGQDSGVFHLGDEKIDRYDDHLARYHGPDGRPARYRSTIPPPFWVAPRHSPSP